MENVDECLYVCIYVCLCVYMYVYGDTHTDTHKVNAVLSKILRFLDGLFEFYMRLRLSYF